MPNPISNRKMNDSQEVEEEQRMANISSHTEESSFVFDQKMKKLGGGKCVKIQKKSLHETDEGNMSDINSAHMITHAQDHKDIVYILPDEEFDHLSELHESEKESVSKLIEDSKDEDLLQQQTELQREESGHIITLIEKIEELKEAAQIAKMNQIKNRKRGTKYAVEIFKRSVIEQLENEQIDIKAKLNPQHQEIEEEEKYPLNLNSQVSDQNFQKGNNAMTTDNKNSQQRAQTMTELLESHINNNVKFDENINEEDTVDLNKFEVFVHPLIEKLAKKYKIDDDESDKDKNSKGGLFQLFYLLTSFLFIIIFVTELNLSKQQNVQSLIVSFIDNQIYDFQIQHVRQDAGSVPEIQQYVTDLLIPLIYDEVQKNTNGYSNLTVTDIDSPDIKKLQEQRIHMIGQLNYFAGMRFIFKKTKFSPNNDTISQTVLPNRQDYYFTITESVEDNRDPINITNTTYEFSEKDGSRQTGGYTIFFEGSLTYSEAVEKVNDIIEAEFFDEATFLYMSAEIFTYNRGYQNAGFTIFEFWKRMDGTLWTNPTNFLSVFPENYDNINGSTIFKMAIIYLYVFGLVVQTIQYFFTVYQYIKEFIRIKEMDIAWYDFVDAFVIGFCIKSMYYWFILYSSRNSFQLPINSENEFHYQVTSAGIVKTYLQISSFAVLFLCIKNLRILTTYFPAFGILFDTFRTGKTDLLVFFVMCIFFMVAFTFSGNFLFGFQEISYSNALKSVASLFRMLNGDFRYSLLFKSNREFSLYFFMIYIVIFFLVLLNLLITIVSAVYDCLRQKKALESMAQARILSRDNIKYIKLWINLLTCRQKYDQDQEQVSIKQDEEQVSKVQILKKQTSLVSSRSNQYLQQTNKKQQLEILRQKNSIRTICLNNKAKLFQKKMLKTKEQMEDELEEEKNKILYKKKKDRYERVKRFMKTDQKAIQKLKGSLIYLLFIIVFVSMISMQLRIHTSASAQKGPRLSLQSSYFKNILMYTPFNESHLVFTQYTDPEDIYTRFPNATIPTIFESSLIYDWMTQSLFKICYGNEEGSLIRQNKFFGDSRVKISFRKLKMIDNYSSASNSVIPYYREIDVLEPIKGPQEAELQKSFKGSSSGRKYIYKEAGDISTHQQNGGFVISLPNNATEASQIVLDIIADDIFDGMFANALFEYVTYNVPYQAFVLTSVTFIQNSAGQIIPKLRSKSIRKALYSNSLDYFRGVLEVVYVLFTMYYLYTEIKNFIMAWKQTTQTEDENKVNQEPSESQNCFHSFCKFIEADYFFIINKSFVTIIAIIKPIYQIVSIIYTLGYLLKWSIFVIIKLLKVFLTYISSDIFKLFNLSSLCFSLILIVTWFQIVCQDNFYLDSNGNINNKEFTYIDLVSNISKNYDTYNLYSAINAIIIFFRILQFFSFSVKLSAFTEILSSSSNDILFFMLMFIIILFGYCVMAYSLFGAMSQKFSDLFYSTLELFKIMNNVFDYDSYKLWSPECCDFFFVSFMLLFAMLLKNMFIAIIMAHYAEFTQYNKIHFNSQSNEKTQNNFHQLLFQAMRIIFCPVELNQYGKKSKIIKCYVRQWNKLEKMLIQKQDNNNQFDFQEEERKIMEEQLINKYDRPVYKAEELNNYMKPFIYTEVSDHQGEEKEKRDRELLQEKELKYGGDNQDNKVLMVNYINVIPRNFEGLTEDQMSSSNIWVAALEKSLFNMSQKEILFSDLYESNDQLKEFDIPTYNVEDFDKVQAEFLMKEDSEKIILWETSSSFQKLNFWKVLDFEKMFEDESRLSDKHGERLENYFDALSEMSKTENKECDYKLRSKFLKTIPILTFKRVIKSPELNDYGFNQASDLQKLLWCQHTNDQDKYTLWFELFTSYNRTKLWNKLSFSEDYFINLINTSKYRRQDLVVLITKALCDIKEDYMLEMKNQVKEQENELILTVKIDKKQTKKLNKRIHKIEQKEIKIQDIAKLASYHLREESLSSQFFIECINVLNTRKYKMYKEVNFKKGKHSKNQQYLENIAEFTVKIDQIQQQENSKSRSKLLKRQNSKPLHQMSFDSQPIQSGRSHRRQNSQQPLFQNPTQLLNDINQKMEQEEENEYYEFKKINKKIFIEAKRTLYSLMTHGLDGQRIKNMHQHHTSDDTKGRYFSLLPTFDKNEQRLPLWLALPLNEKLKMLCHQSIDREAEIMTMLIIEEIEKFPRSQYIMAEIDKRLERAFDHQIYEKYRRLTEWQALKCTSAQAEKRIQRLEQEDFGQIELIQYLHKKYAELNHQKKYMYKDIVKKYKDNELWRHQYQSKMRKFE